VRWTADDCRNGESRRSCLVVALETRARSRLEAEQRAVPLLAEQFDEILGIEVPMRWLVSPGGLRFFLTRDKGQWQCRGGPANDPGPEGGTAGVREPRKPGPHNFPPGTASLPHPPDG
jgi:hypothetical protein